MQGVHDRRLDAVGHRERGEPAVVVDHVEVAIGGRQLDRLERPRDVVDLIQRALDLVGCWVSSSVTTAALETEPGAQNSVTACPLRTSVSVSTLTTSSTPP